MFKLFHKFYNSFIFTTPSVHYIQPKTLNVYFKNAINPKYRMINLSHYPEILLDILQDKEGEDKVFKLVLLVSDMDKEDLILGKFESKREAEDALIVLKNKLYSPEKSFVKLMTIFAVLFFVFIFVLALFQNNLRPSQPQVVGSLNQQLLQNQLLQNGSAQAGQNRLPTEEEQVKAYQELQRQRQEADRLIAEGVQKNPTSFGPNNAPTQVAPQANQAPAVEVQQDPSVKNFINGLSK